MNTEEPNREPRKCWVVYMNGEPVIATFNPGDYMDIKGDELVPVVEVMP